MTTAKSLSDPDLGRFLRMAADRISARSSDSDVWLALHIVRDSYPSAADEDLPLLTAASAVLADIGRIPDAHRRRKEMVRLTHVVADVLNRTQKLSPSASRDAVEEAVSRVIS